MTIADSDGVAAALDRYIKCFMGTQVESYFMTYDRSFLSGSRFRDADLLLMELFRRDDIGYRAEAIPAARLCLAADKRVLIVSGETRAATLSVPSYWDLAAKGPLYESIRQALESPPMSLEELALVQETFAGFCRPAVDQHRMAHLRALLDQ